MINIVSNNHTIALSYDLIGTKTYYVDCIDRANNSLNTVYNITIDRRNALPYFTTGPILEDSYLVPENELDLFPKVTTKIWCNGTANDLNGIDDLSNVWGVLYHESSSAATFDTERHHYSDNDCDTGNLNVDGSFSCEFNLQFYALPGNWFCRVYVSDGNHNYSEDNSSVNELLAIEIEEVSLSFGTLRPGEYTNNLDYPITVVNYGNINIDLQIDAWSDYSSPNQNNLNAMMCEIGNIPVSNLRYSLVENTNFFSKQSLISSGYFSETSFDLSSQISGGGGTQKSLFFGLEIPPSGTTGKCNGVLSLIAVKSS